MLRLLTLMAGFGMLTTSALADALDGDWCNADDGKLSVDGAMVITPTGMRVEGIYGRHRFEYVAPDGDWNAGETIILQQHSDQLMTVTIDGENKSEWRPCKVVS